MSDVDDTQTTVEASTDTSAGTPAGAPAADPDPARTPAPARVLDLDAIERDLADVELSLARLDDGRYWTDEVSGDQLPDELLALHPTARRLPDR